ncbi:MAG: hypothetical protein WBC22_02895 [Sedimentisphaerales bacterium]
MVEAKIQEIKALWQEEIDEWVLKAVTKDLYEYPPEIQTIIREEAVQRGLLEESDIELALSAEAGKCDVNEVSVKAHSGERKGYFCPECKEWVYLTPYITLCSKCNIFLESSGYCVKCDRFWAIPPRGLCPSDQTELVAAKPSLARKLGGLLVSGIFLILELYLKAGTT